MPRKRSSLERSRATGTSGRRRSFESDGVAEVARGARGAQGPTGVRALQAPGRNPGADPTATPGPPGFPDQPWVTGG